MQRDFSHQCILIETEKCKNSPAKFKPGCRKSIRKVDFLKIVWKASLAEALGMTLRESHQICQLNLEVLTEPLQLYIPREEIEPETKMETNEAVSSNDQPVESADASEEKGKESEIWLFEGWTAQSHAR